MACSRQGQEAACATRQSPSREQRSRCSNQAPARRCCSCTAAMASTPPIDTPPNFPSRPACSLRRIRASAGPGCRTGSPRSTTLRTSTSNCSIGGWIAAEMATKAPRRFRRIVLSAPVGVKTGPTDRLDIPDIFAMPEEQLAALMFHDPANGRREAAAIPDAELAVRLRNRESLALLTWEPYMHNSKLRHRLHRVDCPVLFLRGQSDGLISDEYLRRYAALLPDARCETIAAAGHAPEVEQPDAFAARIAAFLGASTGA